MSNELRSALYASNHVDGDEPAGHALLRERHAEKRQRKQEEQRKKPRAFRSPEEQQREQADRRDQALWR